MLKKLFLLFVLAIAGGVGTAYYFYRQATDLPNWYRNAEVDNTSEEVQSSVSTEEINLALNQNLLPQDTIEERLSQAKSQEEVQITEQEIQNWILSEIAKDEKAKAFLQSTKAIHTQLKEDKFELGTIIDTSRLSQLGVGEQQQQAIEKFLENVPQLQNRDIHLAIEGKLEAKNGKIILGKDTKVKVGKLNFSISEIAQKFGISEDQLQQELGFNLENTKIDNINIDPEVVKIDVQ